MQMKQNNLQISRSRGRWIIKFIEDLNKNAEYWIHLSATQKRILTDNVYAIITYQSMLKESVVKIVNKSGDENCSQDNLCLERTRSNTPKIFGIMRTPTFCARLGKPRAKLQMWDFDPIPSESRNWPNKELQGQAVHAKNWRFLFLKMVVEWWILFFVVGVRTHVVATTVCARVSWGESSRRMVE